MARINIEDSIKSDIRFVNLAIKLGSMKLALGELTWAWMTAQRFYLKTKDKCIPKSEWLKQECNDCLIDVGLAELRGESVWIKGSDEQFSWLTQRSKAGQKRWDSPPEQVSDRTATEQRPHSVSLNLLSPSSFLSSHNSKLNTLSSNVICPEVQKAPSDSRQTFKISSFNDFELVIDKKTQSNLAELYPDYEYIRREFLKMHNWLLANPKKNLKTSKGWRQFVSSWLDKGWDKHQKTIPSNKANQSTVLQADIESRINDLFKESP